MNAEKKIFSKLATQEKLEAITEWLDEKKGAELISLDLQGLNAIAEGIIIASATSMRHAQGLADHVLSMCRKSSFEFLNMEGYQGGQWILLDCNDIIVNIFQEDARKDYRLEELWPTAKKLMDKRSF